MFANVLNFSQFNNLIFFKLELLLNLHMFIQKLRRIQFIIFPQDFFSLYLRELKAHHSKAVHKEKSYSVRLDGI